MAKDGTNRGGRRIRAGDKPLPLADKITKGKAAKILEVPELHPESILPLPWISSLRDFKTRSRWLPNLSGSVLMRTPTLGLTRLNTKNAITG